MSLLPCLAKLQRDLRDFDASDVRDAAKVYASRGMEDKAANVAAVEDHLRQLRASRARIVDQVLSAWKERDPEGYAKAQRPALDLQGENEAEIRTREAVQAKDAQAQRQRDNAPSEKGFTLTGSDRPADEAEARGQKAMFSRGPIYYSELGRQVDNAKTESAPPAQWKAFIDNLASKGVKRDEIEWSGVKDWLDLQQGKVTKAQVSEFLKNNGVRVEETMLGGKGDADYERIAAQAAAAHEKALALSREAMKTMGDLGLSQLDRANLPHWLRAAEDPRSYPDEIAEANRKIASLRLPEKVQAELREWARADIDGQRLADQREGLTRGSEARFSQYKLPGGENYRELLLTLPADKVPVQYEVRQAKSGDWVIEEDGRVVGNYGNERAVAEREVAKLRDQTSAGVPDIKFRSNHFDQPNILAHVRFDERTDPAGKKVLFIEEIQSDWAQKGKREGFQDPKRQELDARRREIEAKGADATPEERREWADLMNRIRPDNRDVEGNTGFKGVPAGPFVGKTEAWVALAVKRMVRYAAENGFDRVAWTNGEQQAERYQLSKHINKVTYEERTGAFKAVGNDSRVAIDRMVKPAELADLIGKEVAERLMDKEPNVNGIRVLHGLELKIGGEGMKAFYDKIVPNVVNDILKKVGGERVDKVRLPSDGARTYDDLNALSDDIAAKVYGRGTTYGSLSAESQAKIREMVKNRELEQPGFDITPKMRDEAMKGLPLFKRETPEAEKPAQPAGTGMKEDQTRAALKGAIENTKVPIRVVQSVKDLPFEAPADAKGAFHDGKIWAVADNLADALDAERTIARHEVTHAGLDVLYGDAKAREVALTKVVAANPKVREIARAWRGQYGDDVRAQVKAEGMAPDAVEREVRLTSFEEGLAHFAEEGNEIRGWQQFVAVVQKGLRSLGLDRVADWLEHATNAEALSLLDQARRATREESMPSDRFNAAPAFSRKPNEAEQKADVLQMGLARERAEKIAKREAESLPEGSIARIGDALAKTFAPAARGKNAGDMAGIMRSNFGKQARDRELAEYELRGYAKTFDKMPKEQNYAFINAMEGGEKLGDQKLQMAADAIRKLLDGRRDQVIALGKGNLENFIENYFPHMWKDPDAVGKLFGRLMGRRPFQGSKDFLKQRTIDTFQQGIDAGYDPISSNPVELALLKAREMDRYIYAQKMFEEMKQSGLAKFVRFGDKSPDGWTKINDSIARVYSKTDQGTVIRGEYYAPEQAATLINNHLSPGFSGNAFYDAWRGAGNAMNSAQLGLGAFHLGFTTLDASISRVALGIKQTSRGEVLRGGYTAISGMAPWQAVANLVKGDKLLKAYLGDLKDPAMAPIVEALVEGGGRARMDPFYRVQEQHNFREAVKLGRYGEAARRLPGRVIDALNWGIFEYLVPRQKLGVFFDMAQDALRRNPDMTVDEKRATFGKLWDSVDNRMGEMVYDNVFWNRALKDTLMGTVRSVGWNLGTFRELGGGVKDIPSTLKRGELSDRTAYIIALPLVTGVLGSMVQYAYTGQGPQELKDVWFPRTGRKNKDGSPERLSLPSYMKDVYEYAHDAVNFAKHGGDPLQTVKNKLQPLLSTVAEMLANKDFYGDAIRSPGDPALVQVQDELKFLAKQLTPFGIRNYLQHSKAEKTEPTIAGYLTSGQFYGLGTAPGYITHTPEQEESLAISRNRDSQVKKFRQELKDGTAFPEVAQRMRAAGMSQRDIEYVRHTSGDTMKQKPLKHYSPQ
jgi:hypothetical protein